MQPLFEFIDYRKFLAHYYTSKKESFPNFSFRYFSQKIGINSPSFLKHVIDGKRNLTSNMSERFCKALGLSTRESRYFRNLVLFNQAKTSGEKQEYYAVLRSMAGAVKESVLGVNYYDYFMYWYNPIVRELLCLYDFKDNFRLIAASVTPPIKPIEAKTAIALLLRLKLVEKLPDGKYRQTATALIADDSVTSLAVRSFAREMLENSKAALDAFDKKERHISGITMGISTEAFNAVAAEIEAFKDRVKVIVNRDSEGSRVYQLNICMFPASENMDTVKAEESKITR